MKLPRLFLLLLLVALFYSPALETAEAIAIHDIQFTEDASGNSPYMFAEVTISGVVTAISDIGYVVSDGPGPWNAILVGDFFNGPPAVGDQISITGTVYELTVGGDLVFSDGVTTIADVTSYQHHSSGNAVVPNTVAEVGDVAQEGYESVLVKVEDVFVLELLSYGEWVVTNGTTGAICNDLFDYMYFPAVGDQLESLAGIVLYSFGAYKIEPRDTRDIAGDPIPHYALHGHVVTMNDNRDVLRSSYVEILGDRIVAIHQKRPRGLPVIAVGGLIFPGLIDAHNHPQYNELDLIPFTRLFQDRYEWRPEQVYQDFGDQHDSILDFGGGQFTNVVKLAEVRAATAGTTMIQGSITGSRYARQGIGIDNTGRFPDLMYASTFPFWQPEWLWPWLGTTVLNRFVIHLAEGISPDSLDEFYAWKEDLGMLDHRTSIIHGVALGPDEWDAMAAVGANLIWSPVSNVTLYGQTADIPGALEAGVTVALSADWTESGSPTILDEMKFASQHSQETWGLTLTPLQLTEFVTRNAAHALGVEDWLGQIAPGYRANLMVIPGSPQNPYRTLLRADPADVRLTAVNGRPICGNPDLMARFPFLSMTEPIVVGGKPKTLALAVDAHGITDSDRSYQSILEELLLAYGASSPKICDFIGIH